MNFVVRLASECKDSYLVPPLPVAGTTMMSDEEGSDLSRRPVPRFFAGLLACLFFFHVQQPHPRAPVLRRSVAEKNGSDGGRLFRT